MVHISSLLGSTSHVTRETVRRTPLPSGSSESRSGRDPRDGRHLAGLEDKDPPTGLGCVVPVGPGPGNRETGDQGNGFLSGGRGVVEG